MATPLMKAVRRELVIDGTHYMVTMSPTGVRIVEKGHRKGQEISWEDLLSGGAQLDAMLRKSLSEPGAGHRPRTKAS
jgi:hypothetical protein